MHFLFDQQGRRIAGDSDYRCREERLLSPRLRWTVGGQVHDFPLGVLYAMRRRRSGGRALYSSHWLGAIFFILVIGSRVVCG